MLEKLKALFAPTTSPLTVVITSTTSTKHHDPNELTAAQLEQQAADQRTAEREAKIARTQGVQPAGTVRHDH